MTESRDEESMVEGQKVGYRRWEFGAEPKGIGSGKVKGGSSRKA
jgi:hypothetical protein